MEKRLNFSVSGFVLRIIAMVTILFDHVGLLFIPFDTPVYYAFRLIGRFAFVLFAFFLTEGIIYTKNKNKYLLRFFYLYLIITAFSFIAFSFDSIFVFKNVFATLLGTGCLLVYLENKEWKKVYYLVPFILLLGINIAFLIWENSYLALLSGDYLIYGIIIILGFYFARKLAEVYLRKYPRVIINDDEIATKKANQKIYNVFAVLAIVLIHLIYHFLSYFTLLDIDNALQSYSLLIIPLLLLYSGQKGYSSKTFRTIYYWFFPVHLILLATIFILI